MRRVKFFRRHIFSSVLICFLCFSDLILPVILISKSQILRHTIQFLSKPLQIGPLKEQLLQKYALQVASGLRDHLFERVATF